MARDQVDILAGGGWPTWLQWVQPIGDDASLGVTQAGHPLRWRPVFRDVTDPDIVRQVRFSKSVGIISADTPAAKRAIRSTEGRPIVLVEPTSALPGQAAITHDNRAIGALAADHLHERGCQHFAFVGVAQPWSRQRQQGFFHRLGQLGVTPERQRRHILRLDEAINPPRRLIQRLPDRVGVFGAADWIATRVIRLLEAVGRPIPSSAAVVGSDNNDLHCSYATTPLSSVDPDFAAIGHAAAEAMTAMLHGDAVPPAVTVPPKRVVERASTRRLLHGDPVVDQAARIMRDEARWPLSIAEVADELAVSRRTLEARFRQVLGCTPANYQRDLRLQLADRLIASTRLSLTEIAFRCGFSGSANFSRSFRAAFGIAPSERRADPSDHAD
ncbi:MAG: substrate-binding domain-containing protein [Planctomycetota bacterium]